MDSLLPITEAVVLCGGFGSRLRTAVSDRPKALVDVGGRPLIEWILLALARRNIRQVILATGHMGDQLEDHFGTALWCGIAIRFSRENQPLGTAGALRTATLTGLRSNELDFQFGDDVWRYAIRQMPELAVAYSESVLRDMVDKAGLRIREIRYGSWTGRPDGLSYQDVVLLEVAGRR